MDWLSQCCYEKNEKKKRLNPCCNGLAFADHIVCTQKMAPSLNPCCNGLAFAAVNSAAQQAISLNPCCNGLAFADLTLKMPLKLRLNPCCNGLAFAVRALITEISKEVLILVVMDWLSQLKNLPVKTGNMS